MIHDPAEPAKVPKGRSKHKQRFQDRKDEISIYFGDIIKRHEALHKDFPVLESISSIGTVEENALRQWENWHDEVKKDIYKRYKNEEEAKKMLDSWLDRHPSPAGNMSANALCVGGSYNILDRTIQISALHSKKEPFSTSVENRQDKIYKYRGTPRQGYRKEILTNVSFGMEANFIHEYGHAVEAEIEHYYKEKVEKTLRELHKSFTDEEITYGISEYASSSYSEFFAECFLEGHMPDPRPIAQDFMATLREVYVDKNRKTEKELKKEWAERDKRIAEREEVSRPWW